MERLTNYESLSNTLARLTDEELAALVVKAPPLHAGVGGRSVLLTIDSTPIFVKRIPLTDLERRQEHVRSTANLFDIPLSCHYGLGGPGFSAWAGARGHRNRERLGALRSMREFPSFVPLARSSFRPSGGAER